jgi:hypothetical protein
VSVRAVIARAARASGVAAPRVWGGSVELHVVSKTVQCLGNYQHTLVVLPSSPGEDLEQGKVRSIFF